MKVLLFQLKKKKKNDKKDVNNYRGITLVSCFSKIFTGVLNNRIANWIENNGILSDAQFGFRKNRSTTDAVFVLHSLIQYVLNRKTRLYCAFVDLKKAFDSVYRNGLWFKLYYIGLKGKILRVIRNMYSAVKLRIRSCNDFSDFFECAVGLKQGEVISPLSFSLFLEDLELFLADDVNSGITIDEIMFILLHLQMTWLSLGKVRRISRKVWIV